MNGPLVFVARNGAKLKLDEAVVAHLAAFRQLRPKDTEAGGVLLGRHILDSPNKVVDIATGPLPGDKRARYEFKRGRARHQERVDQAWVASRGTCVYLGEWHTHPEPVPTPSSVDLGDWRRRLQTDVFDGDTLYFVIVGTCAVRVWEGKKSSSCLSSLDVIDSMGGRDRPREIE